MTSPTAPSPGRAPRPSARRALGCGVVVVLAGVLGGCGVRLETPDPPVLVADQAEQLRDRSAREAAALADAAASATPAADDAVAAVLSLVAAASAEHVSALGGVYDPFPGVTPGPNPTPTPTGTPEPPTADTVLEELRAAAAASRADATTIDDPDMAHLLTAITLNRLLLVDALATALGGAAPELGEVTVPDALPAGMDPQAAVVLVQSEDAAGMAWEVVAARSADDARGRAADRAALHRERAQAWAEAAGIAGTGTDPRRSAYDLPDAITAADAPAEPMWTALGQIEDALGLTYADLVPSVVPEARDGLLDAALEALRRAASLHVAVPALPGMAAGS